MLYRKLGQTGETVSAIGLGGSHIGKAEVSETEGLRIIHEAIDRGITFLDNSWDYNEGRSESRVGTALAQNHSRNKAFVMTKIDGRNKDIAANQIDTSLKRLKTDHIDLLQFHEVIATTTRTGSSPKEVRLRQFRRRNKRQGSFHRLHGHKDPHIHLYMLEVAAKHGFHFDTAQMPLNVMDAHFRSFANSLFRVSSRKTSASLG